MVGRGYGKRPGGQSYVPVKEVGSGCDREVIRQRLLLMGDCSREEKVKRSIDWKRRVGRGGIISCNN